MDWRKHDNPNGRRCSIDECDKPHHHKGYCCGHAHRLRRHGDLLAVVGRGNAGKRRGVLKLAGEFITTNGYRRIRIEDGNNKVRWEFEHRRVMETRLNRSLLKGESVHHKDGNRLNNAPENLELWIKPQLTGVRVEGAILWAKEIIERYENKT